MKRLIGNMAEFHILKKLSGKIVSIFILFYIYLTENILFSNLHKDLINI